MALLPHLLLAAAANDEQVRASLPEVSSASGPSNPRHHDQPAAASAAHTCAASTSNPDPQRASLTLSVSDDGFVQAGIAATRDGSRAQSQHQQESAAVAEEAPNVGDILQAGLMLAETAMEEQEASPSQPESNGSSLPALQSKHTAAAEASVLGTDAAAEAPDSSQTSSSSHDLHAEGAEAAAGTSHRQGDTAAPAGAVAASRQQPQASSTSSSDGPSPYDATGEGQLSLLLPTGHGIGGVHILIRHHIFSWARHLPALR